MQIFLLLEEPHSVILPEADNDIYIVEVGRAFHLNCYSDISATIQIFRDLDGFIMISGKGELAICHFSLLEQS